MYSYEDRLRAVQLYIRLGKRVGLTIRQLGYPTKNALKRAVCETSPRGRCRNEGRFQGPGATGSVHGAELGLGESKMFVVDLGSPPFQRTVMKGWKTSNPALRSEPPRVSWRLLGLSQAACRA